MSLKGEDALVLAMDYADKTMAGAGGLKGDPGASAYEIAVANGFEGSEKEWIESLQTAKKLEVPVNIGKASFDGSSDITAPNIMGHATLNSTGNTNVGKYAKFATIDITEKYNACSGYFSIVSTETPKIRGLLYFYFKKSNSSDDIVLEWQYISGFYYVDNIVAVKVDDNTYELYFAPKTGTTYVILNVTLLDCNAPNRVTLHYNQSYVDSVEIAARSTYNVDRTPTEGSANLITSGGVYTAISSIAPASCDSNEYSTGKTWLDGNTIYRKDFAWKITNLTVNQDNVVYLTSLMANAVQTSMYVTDANMIVQSDATVSNIHCDNTGYKIKVNPTTTEIVLTGFIEYVLGDYSYYTNYTTAT